MQFTSENFNEGLAEGRLTRLDVDNTLKRMKCEVGGTGKQCKVMCLYFTFLAFWIPAFIIGLILLGDDDDDDSKDDHEDKDMNGG